jgi:hypothetical protein
MVLFNKGNKTKIIILLHQQNCLIYAYVIHDAIHVFKTRIKHQPKGLGPLEWTKSGQVLEEFGYFNLFKYGRAFA